MQTSRVARTLLVVALAGMSSLRELRAQTSEDDAAIRRSVEAMTSAFNRRDDDATIRLVTPDADFVTVTGHRSRSPAEYIVARRKRFATALKHASIRTLETKIRFLRPDLALVHVTHEIRGMLDAKNRELPPHTELSLRVYVKKDGKWLMTSFQNTAVAPR